MKHRSVGKSVTREDHPMPHSQRRPIPRIEDSLTDCGYLFSQFRKQLTTFSRVGVVGVYLPHCIGTPGTTTQVVALFLRMANGKLRGTIEGGYQSSTSELFILLAPGEEYHDADFDRDLATIRSELSRRFHVMAVKHGSPLHGVRSDECEVRVDGVLLANQPGETTDNTLFRAFQELFGASSQANRRLYDEKEEIRRIIATGAITPVFQPIFCLATGRVHGYEALSRIIPPSSIGNPEELFEKARRHNLAQSLEMLCRHKALEAAARTDIGSQRLFLNVCPAILAEDDHQPGKTAMLLKELNMDRSRLIFELTEQTLISDYALFRKLVSYYRDQGYSIAIDDLGAGYAGLGMLAEVVPDYVKLARFLVSGIDGSPTRQALVEALVSFCDKIGARVIAEGIEREEELMFLARTGVNLGQGYLLAKPSAQPYPNEICPLLV